MAKIAYHSVLDSLKLIFEADVLTSDSRVFVEQEPQIGLQDVSKVLVLVLNRRNATPGQSLAAGKRQRYMLSFSVWIMAFSIEDFNRAAVIRDDLLASAELVLMANRTISGTVESLQLDGGEFYNAKSDNGSSFCAMAEIQVQAQVSAIS